MHGEGCEGGVAYLWSREESRPGGGVWCLVGFGEEEARRVLCESSGVIFGWVRQGEGAGGGKWWGGRWGEAVPLREGW